MPLLLLIALVAPMILAARAPLPPLHGMVVSREENATDAGVAVLKAGGNAVDAAVAVGFALAVTHPSAGNLGGGGFLLARFADGRATFIDFRERAPLSSTRDMYLDAAGRPTGDSVLGYRAAGVPGTVRGLEYAHQKYGRRPWAELVEPSVKLARDGFPISFALAKSLRGQCEKFELFADSKRIFLNGGRYYDPGDLLIQQDLAAVLGRIQREGARDFYEGRTAQLLADDMKRNGGHVTLEDLRRYEVVERKPIEGTYRGYPIITAPPPSSGGIGILQMLGMLEKTDFAKAGFGSAYSLHYMAEAMRRYFADRSEHMGDPDFFTVPTTKLLAPEYIDARRASIDPARATPSAEIKPGAFARKESEDTTHFTIVDGDGNVVSLTYTLNGSYGSHATATGLGFLLNNEMDDFSAKPGEANMYGVLQGEGNAIAPRKHPLSSMTPTIVLDGDGKFWFAVGSPGGPTIINTVLCVVVNMIDFKMNIRDAVEAPRIHHQWTPDELRMERIGFSPDTVALLESRGHAVRFVAAQGEVAGVAVRAGWLEGAADSRTESQAKGY